MSTQLSEAVNTAAQLGALGLDAMRFLETEDEDERNLMVELGRRIFEVRQELDNSLAVNIANKVGEVFKT